MRAIIHGLGDRLSLFQAQPNLFNESIPFSHVLRDGSYPDLAMIIRAQAWRISAIHHSKWCILEDGVEGRIVDVFCPR